MADKSISELVAATAVGSLDLFVLEQGGTAKKLTGQILENWLVALADGHGGIQTVAKTGTSGLVDTYTITYADTTTSTFTVTNGKAITGITQYWAVSTSDTTVPSQWYTTRQTMTPTNKYLWSYLHIAYNDSTSTDTTKSVVGVYGDTGAQTYVWIKYAGVQPTSDSDMGDTPDKWIGIYVGLSSTAPTSYAAYTWYQYKGEKGDTGDASEVTAQSVTYLEGTSGTVVPQGSWTTTVPSVTPGNFLWTRTQLTFNDQTSITAYSVSRYGIDGTGAVSTVNNQGPDTNGNVALNASNIPTSDSESVQTKLDASATAAELATFVRPNLLDNWYFVGGGSQLGDGVFPINQRGQTSYSGVRYAIDRWKNINSQVTTNIASNGLSLSTSASSGSTEVVQWLKRKIPAGTKVTLSAIVSQTENVTDTTTGIMRLKGTNGYVYSQLGFDLVAFSQKLYTITDIVPEEIAGFVFRIPNNGSLIVHACKLELGDTQTLAHQENGVWVLNEIPDFGEQLAKCQRIFERIKGSGTTIGAGFIQAATTSRVIVATKVSKPSATITVSGTLYVSCAGHTGSQSIPSTTVSETAFSVGNALIVMGGMSELTTGQACLMQIRDSASYIDISAEL